MNAPSRCVITVGLLTAASGCTPNTTGSTMHVCQSLAGLAPSQRPRFEGTVFTIVLENHSRDQVIGNKHAPFITSLARQYTEAHGYHDSFIHPSEPNYIWLTSGENFDILDDEDPAAHHLDSRSHIADQLEAAGVSWRAYEEAMGTPCGLTSHGRYAAKHDPFVYYNDVNGWDGTQFQPSARCTQHIVDYTNLATDLASPTMPRYAFITPDLDHDMHDGSVAEGDAWLAQEVPKIMASDAYQRGGSIMILWDEGGGYPASDDPPFILISQHGKPGYVSEAAYDESSYLETVELLLGTAPLPCVTDRATVDTMDDLYAVPIRTHVETDRIVTAPAAATATRSL